MGPQILVKEIHGETVLLNLETEEYFGLDRVGTRMWTELTAAASIGEACEALRREYDVDDGTLRRDLAALVEDLRRFGLIEVRGR